MTNSTYLSRDLDDEAQAKFRSFCIPDGECLRWSANVHRGYPVFILRRMARHASQIAWFLAKKEAPPTRLQRMCKTELCVNPEHFREYQKPRKRGRPKKRRNKRRQLQAQSLIAQAQEEQLHNVQAARRQRQMADYQANQARPPTLINDTKQVVATPEIKALLANMFGEWSPEEMEKMRRAMAAVYPPPDPALAEPEGPPTPEQLARERLARVLEPERPVVRGPERLAERGRERPCPRVIEPDISDIDPALRANFFGQNDPD